MKPNLSVPRPLFFRLAVTAAILATFFFFVDLKPRVEEAFFFSSDDPQFKADKIISEIFPQPPQIVVGVKGEIASREYAEKIGAFSETVASLPEVFAVQSLTRGPDHLQDALSSPLWKRILLAKDGQSTFVSIFIKETSTESVIPKIEKLRGEFHEPGFEMMISGSPYIIERIRQSLFRDLQVFSGAAFLVFGLVLFVIFRSSRILLGTLLTCVNASALTLILARLFGIPVGPLTANLSTMVFVLTLSPIVFLTFNWRYLKEDGGGGRESVRQAVALTLPPSFWSMATTLVGFLSLLFVQATPLRQLGISGALGTFVAFASAYTFYPWFLEGEAPESEVLKKTTPRVSTSGILPFFAQRRKGAALFLLCLILVLLFGLFSLNTDPDLLSYFRKGSELYQGLEYIDQNGGSSPLKVVVVDKTKMPFDTGDAYKKLWRLHEALEEEPAVGNVVSLPLLLAEAKSSPLTFFLTTGWLLNLMESPKFGEIAKYFLTKDRMKTLFLLRMKELEREGPRLEVIDRVRGIIEKQGFGPVLWGGVYVLQGKMSELLASSLVSGILLLLGLFTAMGWFFLRSRQIAVALFVSLAVIPVSILGLLGYLRIPLDVISTPAANLALSMGVDAMIYLMAFVRRSSGERTDWNPWSRACSQLWRPIGTSLVLIGSGFSIFLLSGFPPTQRFGLSVVLGSAAAACSALFLFPWFATLRRESGRPSKIVSKP